MIPVVSKDQCRGSRAAAILQQPQSMPLEMPWPISTQIACYDHMPTMAAMMSAATAKLDWNGLQVYRALKSGVQVVAAKVFQERDPNSSSSSSSYAASRASGARSDVFKQEIAILKSCHDRNIVQFIGACLQPDCTIMVMEYLEGGDLYHAIANDSAGRFSWYKRWGQHVTCSIRLMHVDAMISFHACCGIALTEAFTLTLQSTTVL